MSYPSAVGALPAVGREPFSPGLYEPLTARRDLFIRMEGNPFPAAVGALQPRRIPAEPITSKMKENRS